MAINKYFTDESLELFVDKIKEYTDNAVSQNSNTCEHDELTNEQIDAILGPLDGGSGDDSGSGDSASSPDIELDGTLTQSGMAADAKVVGDRLATKANINHTHDFSISSIPSLQTVLDGKAALTHTHNVATTSANGFMSIADKTKLNNIESGANKTIVDSAISSSSMNPVQNKVVNTALENKVPNTRTINGKSLSSDVVLSASDIGADVFGSANNALEAAKSYADSASSTAANTVKNDLLNGAGEAYDTLKELGDLISTNVNAIDALEIIATDKANKIHAHSITDITDLQSILNGKSDSSHNHNDDYDEKGSANTALVNAKTYVDEAISDVNDVLASAVKTVNNVTPDSNGNVVIGVGFDSWTDYDKAGMLQYMLDSLPNGDVVSY